jgi:hypothetical protein
MALGPEDVATLKIGKLSPYTYVSLSYYPISSLTKVESNYYDTLISFSM